MKSKITKVTKGILDFMFVSGIIVTLSLPLSLKIAGKYIDDQLLAYQWQMVAIYGVCGVLALLIISELRKIFKTVLKDDCFVRENVSSLERMGNYSFIIVILLLVKSMFYVTIASLALLFVFIIAGLFSKVLAQVFDRAVSYKLENDLTI